MIRTFVALRQVDPGFTRPEEVQTFVIAIPAGLISDAPLAARTFESVAERLSQVPGVASVGLSSSITMDGEDNGNPVEAEGVPIPEDGRPRSGGSRASRRDTSRPWGSGWSQGDRLRGARSTSGGPSSSFPSRSRVRCGENPRERSATASGCAAVGTRQWREIVGVTGDERDDGLAQPPTAIVYWPMLNERYEWRTMAYAVRSSRVGTPRFLRELERAVWAVNPNLPLARVQTVEEIRAHSMAQTSFALVMLGIAASVALLIGVVGIYGVIAYAVAQRTREIGIRMALGAQIADVQNMFLRQGLWLTATGILIGIGVAMVVTRVMSAFLFGVGPMDPVTYAAVSGTLAAVAIVGTYLPARRATRVDPLAALRAE